MAENKRYHPPKVAITEAMLLAANTALYNIKSKAPAIVMAKSSLILPKTN